MYLEYENNLAKGKNKEVWTRYNRKIEIDSLEYTLSNAIISEVYKNVKCKDGIVDCMELKMLISSKWLIALMRIMFQTLKN